MTQIRTLVVWLVQSKPGIHISLLSECFDKLPFDLGLSLFFFFSIYLVLLKRMVLTGFFLNFTRSTSVGLTRTLDVLFLCWTSLFIESLWRFWLSFIDLFCISSTWLLIFSKHNGWPKVLACWSSWFLSYYCCCLSASNSCEKLELSCIWGVDPLNWENICGPCVKLSGSPLKLFELFGWE